VLSSSAGLFPHGPVKFIICSSEGISLLEGPPESVLIHSSDFGERAHGVGLT
jgi:hypothetical protein